MTFRHHVRVVGSVLAAQIATVAVAAIEDVTVAPTPAHEGGARVGLAAGVAAPHIRIRSRSREDRLDQKEQNNNRHRCMHRCTPRFHWLDERLYR